ncbi:response regulator [Roseomonas sp. M0104]|uniref:Response regulator n=1 Tax=Teichococcus coralli TaxID=2545983 RepID=A0A845BA04_9PROT|nr:response regulator [Pseudoroseomonas coralli]MXP62212.1 response regulator [Pseudoroseomonas coralli]
MHLAKAVPRSLSAAATDMPEEGQGWPVGSVVLVVEDEPLICMNLIQMLEMMDFEAIGVGRAEQALDWLKSNPAPALMITDVSLPGMNGIVLAAEARQLHPGLPVLLASGHAEAAVSLPPALQQGVGFLAKPYSMRQLESAVQGMRGHADAGNG